MTIKALTKELHKRFPTCDVTIQYEEILFQNNIKPLYQYYITNTWFTYHWSSKFNTIDEMLVDINNRLEKENITKIK